MSNAWGPAPDRAVTRNSALVVHRIAGTRSTIKARRAMLSASRDAVVPRSGSPSNPMHTPASSSVIRSRPRRSTPGRGGRGSSRRIGAMHQRCASSRHATQRWGAACGPGNLPSSRSLASNSSPAGTTSSEVAARRWSRPCGSASHILTARPSSAMAARRKTSCHNRSGPLESVRLMETRGGTASGLRGMLRSRRRRSCISSWSAQRTHHALRPSLPVGLRATRKRTHRIGLRALTQTL
jgi:hypothetical protein